MNYYDSFCSSDVFNWTWQLKKDKVELENQLEQEQEALVNRLWKRMDKLEAEKRWVLFLKHLYLAWLVVS